MLAWIRQDEALRGWPVWVLLIAVNAGVAAGLLMSLAAGSRAPVPASWLVLSLWAGVAIYLAFGCVRARCRPMQLALPLSARRLWIIHALAVTLAGSVMAATAVAMMVFQARLLGGAVPPGLGYATMLPHLVAGVALAVVLLQAPSPRLARIPATLGYALWVLVVLGGIFGLLLLVTPLGPAGALVPLLLAVAVGLGVLRSLPAGFTLVPLEAQPGRERAPAASAQVGPAGEGAPSRWIVPASVWRGVSAGGLDWTGFPLVLLFAGVLGGVLSLFGEDLVELRYVYIPLMSFMLFTAMGPRLGRLHHLDPLPISRRVLFAALVAPYFLTFSVGYGLGALGADLAARRAELVAYRETGDSYSVFVPIAVRRVAWDGRAPAAVSPAGESHTPVTWPLWRGSRAALYSPFSAPRGSSRDFVAWQLGRAVEAVYGVRIPASEIAGRYLVTREDGVVAARAGGLTLRRDFPGLGPRHQGPMLPVIVALACLPWLLATGLLLRAYRGGAAEWLRQGLVWIGVGSVVIAFFTLAGITMAGVLRPWLFRAAVEIPVQRLGTLPLGTFAAWGVAAAVLAAAYVLTQSQFVRMEVPTRPTKFTLIDFVREDG